MLSTKDFKEKQILFVFLSRGERVSFRNDNIIVKDKEDKIKHQSTCYLLFALFLIGPLCVTSGLLERASRFGFSIVLMTHGMKVYGILPARAEGNVLLHRKQYAYDSFDLGARLIANKIYNQNALLKGIRNKSDDIKAAITLLENYQTDVLRPGLTLEEIMGLEGVAAKVYFKQLFAEHEWIARRPRVKEDMTNCLLDIGYTLLFNLINGLLEMYGFDTYVGVLHRQFYHRKSLVCDLVEPFRAIIDQGLRKALNLGQCHEHDFTIIQKQYHIYGAKAAPYIGIFLEALMKYKNEIFLYTQMYYRAFMREKETENFPFFKIDEVM